MCGVEVGGVDGDFVIAGVYPAGVAEFAVVEFEVGVVFVVDLVVGVSDDCFQ